MNCPRYDGHDMQDCPRFIRRRVFVRHLTDSLFMADRLLSMRIFYALVSARYST